MSFKCHMIEPGKIFLGPKPVLKRHQKPNKYGKLKSDNFSIVNSNKLKKTVDEKQNHKKD